MEDIISKLAEIEAAASHIMEDVSEQKKELAQQYEIAIRDFDQAVDDEMMAKNQGNTGRVGNRYEGKAGKTKI